ncbi:hypothetical protein [Vagococcus silagei]|uniref:ABC transporter permease n=1 Tax=Vagococcus silagei TaxID=2508885 RepID=A0A4V6RMJ2_9ENTE|nr:hypothetical protein [Vagococcus silagei]THB60329.1 hypothetical protein ESZ54_10790 [Vagococcus silagei]
MKLIKLEIKKINFIPYLIASLVMPIVSLGFMYFLSFVPHFDASVTADFELTNPQFIFALGLMINIAGFVCIGTALLGRIVLDAYRENTIYLTLSYPISRAKIFKAKLATCILFCMSSVIISGLFSTLLFFTSEKIRPILQQPMHFVYVLRTIPMIFIAAILVSSIMLIALFIGWRKKSIALTVTMGVLIFSIPSNFLALGPLVLSLVTLTLTTIAIIQLSRLFSKIKKIKA